MKLRNDFKKFPEWIYHSSTLMLIPLYFLVHNYLLYKEQVVFFSLIPHIVGWFILPLLLYGFLLTRYRYKKRTAWVIAMFILIYFFTFGPVYSFLSSLPYIRILTKVSIISGILITAIIIIIFFPHRINLEKNRLPQFVFTLIALLLVFDFIHHIFLQNRFSGNQYDLKEKDPLPTVHTSLREKPDIYYIIFDELMQTDAMRDYFHYDNSMLDSALTGRGFFVASRSKSAYYATPYSIASAFHSSTFIEKKKKNIHLLDYLIAYKEIQQNTFIPYLIRQGYSIQNFTNYKLFKEDSKEMYKDPSYDPRQIVLNQTFSYLMYHLISGIISNKLPAFISDFVQDSTQILFKQNTNIKKYKEFIQTSLKKRENPLFVHAHFFVPHLPVYFDSTGRPLRYNEVKFYKSEEQSVPAYKMNLAYSRKLITTLVDELLRNTDKQAVIIIQSDHGFRGNKKNPVPPTYRFNNFTAIYYPDRDYSQLVDDFYMPNTFRYFLNKYTSDSFQLVSPEHIQLSSSFLDD